MGVSQMAQLNLRDRVIEATIAYVGGGEHGDASTNFAHLTRDAQLGRASAIESAPSDAGRLLSLEWRPQGGATMNDCELAVRLVSAGGEDDRATAERLLVDADGLVLMLESAPEAEEDNRRAVALVRDVLARDPERRLPVVVQVNRADGGDAAAATALAAEEWPRVVGCASKGDGVMETLQRAVDGVVESMNQRDAAAARPAGGGRGDGNPLLGALRQVLQATVIEQMTALEARLVARMEEQGRKTAEEETSAPPSATAEAMAALFERVERIEAAISDLGSSTFEAIEHLLAASQRTASREDVARLDARLASEAAIDREAAVRAGKEQRRAVQEDTARAAAAALVPLQRTVDALAADVKKVSGLDVGGALERTRAASEGLRAQLDILTAESRTLAERLGDAGSGAIRAADQIGRHVNEVGDAVRAFETKSDARGQALEAELAGLTAEIRKKKTWFG